MAATLDLKSNEMKSREGSTPSRSTKGFEALR